MKLGIRNLELGMDSELRIYHFGIGNSCKKCKVERLKERKHK